MARFLEIRGLISIPFRMYVEHISDVSWVLAYLSKFEG